MAEAARRGAGPRAERPVATGAIPRAGLARPGVVDSAHPATSVAALGPSAAWLGHPHPLPWSCGMQAPSPAWSRPTRSRFVSGSASTGARSSTTPSVGCLMAGARRMIGPGPAGLALVPDAADDLDVHLPEIGRRALARGLAATGRVARAPATRMRAAPVVAEASADLAETLQP